MFCDIPSLCTQTDTYAKIEYLEFGKVEDLMHGPKIYDIK